MLAPTLGLPCVAVFLFVGAGIDRPNNNYPYQYCLTIGGGLCYYLGDGNFFKN